MLFGLNCVMDLLVFGEDGNLITKLETLKENQLSHQLYGVTDYLIVKDSVVNTKMLEMLGNKEETKSDYEKELNTLTSISFGSKKSIKCKIIGKGLLKKCETGADIEFKIEIPNAKLLNRLELNININDYTPSCLDYVFEISKYNEQGDLFKLHM